MFLFDMLDFHQQKAYRVYFAVSNNHKIGERVLIVYKKVKVIIDCLPLKGSEKSNHIVFINYIIQDILKKS